MGGSGCAWALPGWGVRQGLEPQRFVSPAWWSVVYLSFFFYFVLFFNSMEKNRCFLTLFLNLFIFTLFLNFLFVGIVVEAVVCRDEFSAAQADL